MSMTMTDYLLPFLPYINNNSHHIILCNNPICHNFPNQSINKIKPPLKTRNKAKHIHEIRKIPKKM